MIVQSLSFVLLFLLFYVAKSKMHSETYERRLPSFYDGQKSLFVEVKGWFAR